MHPFLKLTKETELEAHINTDSRLGALFFFFFFFSGKRVSVTGETQTPTELCKPSRQF